MQNGHAWAGVSVIRRGVVAAAAMTLAISPIAHAQDASVGIDTPATIKAKLSGDARLYYPERAERLGIDGAVMIECRLAEKHSLKNCAVISQSRSDQNFADAALKMAERRALSAGPLLDGAEAPLGQLVRLIVEFDHRR